MKISAHDAKDQDALFRSIRKVYGTEGSVVYYLNADNKVPGLLTASWKALLTDASSSR